LRPFGLVLHHDGVWSHEGEPILNDKLRCHFDRSVRYLPRERKFVVELGRFRGQIEIEEAGFFVREIDLETGQIRLSDRSSEPLKVATLHVSSRDGALLCRVKQDLEPAGLLARFTHSSHSVLMNALDEAASGPVLRIGGISTPLPDL
jgi:hypothetical protein